MRWKGISFFYAKIVDFFIKFYDSFFKTEDIGNIVKLCLKNSSVIKIPGLNTIKALAFRSIKLVLCDRRSASGVVLLREINYPSKLFPLIPVSDIVYFIDFICFWNKTGKKFIVLVQIQVQ